MWMTVTYSGLIIFKGVYDQKTDQLIWERKQRVALKSPFYRQVEALTWVNSRKILNSVCVFIYILFL